MTAAASGSAIGTPTPDIARIETFWRHFAAPGEVYEVRVTDSRRGPAKLWKTCAGYFRAGASSFIREVARLTGHDAQAVYITLNPVKESLLARANHRLVTDVKSTASDADIVRHAHFFVDTDPERAAGISATDEERDQALTVREAIRDFLEDLDWPDPLNSAMSGNGGSLVYRIDLPNDDVSTALIDGCLSALAAAFDTDAVSVDQSVSNAARLTKIPGTVAAKGDHVPELGRVWRVSEAEFHPETGTSRASSSRRSPSSHRRLPNLAPRPQLGQRSSRTCRARVCAPGPWLTCCGAMASAFSRSSGPTGPRTSWTRA